MIYPKDLTGLQFGHLTVLRKNGQDRHRITIWTCLCDCGKEHDVRRVGLVSHQISSCGCHSMDHRNNRGMKKTTTYACWSAMKNRCTNPNNDQWDNYGGRGITVCERWMKFENFLEDMGIKPDGLSLDRENNNLGYFKENCRWIPMINQQSNKRTTKFVTYKGESICIGTLARIKNFNSRALRMRIERGWPTEKWFDPVKTNYTRIKLNDLKLGESITMEGTIRKATSVWYDYRRRHGGKFSARTIAPNLCEIKRTE